MLARVEQDVRLSCYCWPGISCAGFARVDRAAVRPGGELLRDVESAAWPCVGGGGGPGGQGEWLWQEHWIPPFISFVWIKFGLLSKHPFIQQEVQHNYAQWTLELIRFSIFNSGGKRAKASGQHLFGRDHRTWGAGAARGGGALWIRGLRHFSSSLCCFFLQKAQWQSEVFVVFNRLSRLLRWIQSYNQSRAFQFPSFLTLGRHWPET